MALIEKGVEYELVDVGVLDGECKGAQHLARNPFGKVPVFEHDGHSIYETSAIVRYIDQAFGGASLQPASATDQARMNQIISIQDNYGYQAMILDTVAYYFFPDFIGGADDERLARGKRMASTCLDEFQRLMAGNAYLCGGQLSLADLYIAPSYFYLSISPAADELTQARPALAQWWQRMNDHDSLKATEPDLG